jgi:hypothetical protein
MNDDPPFALSYRRGADYYFIPTVPAARNWRGPYPTEAVMQRALRDELGENAVETRTLVQPEFLEG